MRELTNDETGKVTGGLSPPAIVVAYISFRVGYAIGTWIYDTYTTWRYSN